MKAYKATKNMKSQAITFEIGKTYTFNGTLKIQKEGPLGLHFCKKPRQTLKYYKLKNFTNFNLMEIDVLGDVVKYKNNEFITNKFTVTRVIPKSEYPELLGITLDSNNNVVKQILQNGDTYIAEYDHNNNHTKQIYPNGHTYIYKYDHNNSLIQTISPDGNPENTWSITIS
jgi:hypothetical protein